LTTDKIPESVQVRLRAPEDRWERLALSKFQATLDLSTISEGFKDIPIDVDVFDDQVVVTEIIPELVSLHIQTEKVISLPVIVELTDQPAVGYISRQPVVTPFMITITGSALLISQVDKAVAKISIREAKETIERVRSVILRDRDEGTITGLTINPSRIQIVVPIDQRFDYKDVSVSAMVVGQVKPGYWVSNIMVEPATVTIFGNPNVLNSIPGFIETAPVNLNQATKDIIQVVPLNLPDGVTVVSSESSEIGLTGAKITVNVDAIEGGKTIQRPVKQQGISPGYSWVASPDQVDVILSGPIPRLEMLDSADVEVIVNLFELLPGTHKVKPTLFVPDGLHGTTVLNTIEVTIDSVATPRPTNNTEK
jgi:YbbR domain-containing protein